MSGRRLNVAFPLVVLFGSLGIFLLPWFVPHRQPAFSASYSLGFNNMVATLALAVLLAALFVLRLLRRSSGEGGDIERILSRTLSVPERHGASKSLLITWGATTLIVVSVLLIRYLTVPYIIYGDYGTDITRLDLMVLGMRPYRDFQYTYGPAMLYPAYWLYSLANGRISIDAAYCANLLGQWAAGLFLLSYTVRNLCQGWRGTVVFVCASLASFNLTMGVGYTPLRFLAPVASLILLHRTLRRRIDRNLHGVFIPAGLALLVSLATLSISPEVGIATVAGISLYFIFLHFTPLRRYAVVALSPFLSVALALLLFSFYYTEGLFSFRSGTHNYPVFPTPHILLLVAAACTILPILAVIGFRKRDQNGALAIGLVFALGLLLPAAFGRCDQVHVLFNGLGVMVLLLTVAVQMPRTAMGVLMVGAFLVVHPGLMAVHVLRDRKMYFEEPILYRQNWLSHLPASLNEPLWNSIAQGSNALRYGKLSPFQADLRQLLRFESVGTPIFLQEDIDRFLKLSGRFVPEYYSGFNQQVFTPSALARKIRDLDTMSHILVPDINPNIPVGHFEAKREYLSKILYFPAALIPRPRQLPWDPVREILNHIYKNFTRTGRFRNLNIWRRSDPARGSR